MSYQQLELAIKSDPLKYLNWIISSMHKLDYKYMKHCWPGFQHTLEWLEWRSTLSYDDDVHAMNYQYLIPGLIEAAIKLGDLQPNGIKMAAMIECLYRLELKENK